MGYDFNKFIERILSHEGGYVNDPRDPGGETQWGISKRSYPGVDIKSLTRPQAIEIYRRDFWEPLVGWMPPQVAFQALDAAVNSGMSNAIRWLQRAVGVADDGVVGNATRQALSEADPNDVTLRFLGERLDFMTRLKGWDSYGKGWARRLAQNLRYAAEDN